MQTACMHLHWVQVVANKSVYVRVQSFIEGSSARLRMLALLQPSGMTEDMPHAGWTTSRRHHMCPACTTSG